MGPKHWNLPGRKNLQNSTRDQKPSFQNGLECVQVKRKGIQKHLKAKRRKKKRRRRRKRRNKFTLQFRPRLKSNPNSFIHSITESLLLYQRLVNVTQRVIFHVLNQIL